MKIVIDARELRTTTGRYVERLIYYLEQIDQEHEYTVLLKDIDFDGWQPSNTNFHKIKCTYKEFTFGEQLGLLKQIQQLKPDLVHFPMSQQPILYKGRVVTTIMDLTTTRSINPSKNRILFLIKQSVYKFVVKRVARKSRHIITISDYVKKDLQDYAHIGPSKITTTYPAADTISDPSDPIQSLVDKDFIMYVGRPLPHKNLHRLIDAMVKLHAMKPELKLVIAGKNDVLMSRLKKYATSLHMQDTILFTGFVSEGQLRWLYEHTKAYVFPSLSEGFGLPGLEAMLHGAPVVSSNATCLPEVYKDAAEYFNPLDINDMVLKINEVLDNINISHTLILRGYELVKTYSWQRMAEQTLEIYKKALGES